jgi:hypothetical protein
MFFGRHEILLAPVNEKHPRFRRMSAKARGSEVVEHIETVKPGETFAIALYAPANGGARESRLRPGG